MGAGGTVVAGRVFGMLQVSRALGDARFKDSGVTAEPELVRYVLRTGSGGSGDGGSASDAESEVPYSMPVDLDFDTSADDDDDNNNNNNNGDEDKDGLTAPAGRHLRRCETADTAGAAAVQTHTAAAGECRTVAADTAGRDEFVVIASDGLWGVMSNADVVRFVHQHTRGLALAPEPLDVLQSCANDLVQEALVRGSRDNITATLLFFASESSAPSSPTAAAAPTTTPGALAVLASPPRTSPGSLRRCCSATFAAETAAPGSEDSATQHR